MSIKNKMGWPFQFVQSGAFSLEANTQFADATSAINYVKTDPTAYVGKVITIAKSTSYNGKTYQAGAYVVLQTGSKFALLRSGNEQEIAALTKNIDDLATENSALKRTLGTTVNVFFEEKVCTIMYGYANKVYVKANLDNSKIKGLTSISFKYGSGGVITIEPYELVGADKMINPDYLKLSPGVNDYEVVFTYSDIGDVSMCRGTFVASHPCYYAVGNSGIPETTWTPIVPDGDTHPFNIVGIAEGATLKILSPSITYNEYIYKYHRITHATSKSSFIPMHTVQDVVDGIARDFIMPKDGGLYYVMESDPLTGGTLNGVILHFK